MLEKSTLLKKKQNNSFSASKQATCLAMVGSFLVGFNLSWMNAIGSYIMLDFNICENFTVNCYFTIYFSFNSITVLFIGAAIGSITGGLYIRIGRKFIYQSSLLLFIVGVFTCIFSTSYISFLWARFTMGLSIGLFAFICPMLISEMVDKKDRGFYGCFHQLFITIGIAVPLVCNLVFQTLGDIPLSKYNGIYWRCTLLLCLIPAVIALILLYNFTETPYYYIEKQQDNDAMELLTKIYSKEDVKEEFNDIKKLYEQTQVYSVEAELSFAESIHTGMILAASSQFVGMNILTTASNIQFTKVTLDPFEANLLSVLMAALYIIFTIPAMYLIDRIGRRTLLLIGCTIQTLFILPATVLVWTGPKDWAEISSTVGIIGFVCSYAIGFGPVLWVYLSEMFQAENKGLGSGSTTAAYWIYGIGMVKIGHLVNDRRFLFPWSFYFSLISCFIFFFRMKETKVKSLTVTPYV